MAKTTAERQATYRERRYVGSDHWRLNTWLSTKPYFALARMAKRYGVTKRTMLERLIVAEEKRLVSEMQSDAEFDAYLNL